jgi:hypothetical protein
MSSRCVSFSSCRAMRRERRVFCHCMPLEACTWCIEAMARCVLCGEVTEAKCIRGLAHSSARRSPGEGLSVLMTRGLPDAVILRTSGQGDSVPAWEG